jgi:hypothetical protein
VVVGLEQLVPYRFCLACQLRCATWEVLETFYF